MPLDRIVSVLTYPNASFNAQGEFELGDAVILRLWATRMDKSLERINEEGGERNQAARRYRIRWRSEVARLIPSYLRVMDRAATYSVENVIEVRRSRRRFLDLEVTGEVYPEVGS